MLFDVATNALAQSLPALRCFFDYVIEHARLLPEAKLTHFYPFGDVLAGFSCQSKFKVVNDPCAI
jgi:hypothetical protein